jgi:hypothetical protein
MPINLILKPEKLFIAGTAFQDHINSNKQKLLSFHHKLVICNRPALGFLVF